MANIWKYISAFLAGALAVSIGILMLFLKYVKPVINTDTYVNTLEQSIGKLKQKGKGNSSDITPTIILPVNGKSEVIVKEEEKKERKPFLGIRLFKKKNNN
ncbi:MAG: hypothetical protein ABFD50_19315 [Smithella sp.]